MYEYDVAVVGAGPCGSVAARVAVERGMKTILLEEHAQIGLPEHCLGGWPGRFISLLEELAVGNRVVVGEARGRRNYSPSGKLTEIPSTAADGKTIERNLLDLELARQAANAGAEILINRRVTSLIHENGIVKGVITNSQDKPKIYSKVVIAADGISAIKSGIPRSEGLVEKGMPAEVGILWHLTGVKDIEPGVMEMHFGQFDTTAARRNLVQLSPRDNGICIANFSSVRDFERIKAGNWALSRKIRNCSVLRMTGWVHATRGDPIAKKVKDGLIVAGAAAGYRGTPLSVLSGQFAGQMAAEAVQDGDYTEEKLSLYKTLCEKLPATPRTKDARRLCGLSDKELENWLEKS